MASNEEIDSQIADVSKDIWSSDTSFEYYQLKMSLEILIMLGEIAKRLPEPKG